MTEVLLGIDVGSSSVKACAYSRNGDMLGKSCRPLEISHPRPAWAEMDAEAFWREVAAAAREAAAGLRGGRVAGIGVSSACPTTIFMDGDCRPLRPAVLYLDHRSMNVVRDFGGRHDPAGHFAAAGNRPGSSTSWLANLVWLRENEPDIWRRVRRVSLLGGYLCAKMTGRPVVDWTQASYSGGFRVARPEAGWDDALLSHWDVDRSMLGEVGWSCLPAGTLADGAAAEMGVPPGATVAYGAADTAAAAFALGMQSFGDVFESAGTSGVITFCLDSPRFDDAFMNRCHVVPERWLAHGAMSTLGGAFSWLRRQVWPEIGSMEELQRLAAESPPGANGVVFLPYLAGERSPIWDPEASGLWLGLRVDNSRRDLVRAVFEGTAFGLRQIIERGGKVWNCRPTRLLGVGGGARNRLWAEIKSDVLGVEYLCADEPDAAAWGAAIIGGIASGVFRGVDDPDIRFIAARPMENARTAQRRDSYEKAFSVYETLYPALKGAMHRLAGNARAEGE